MQNIDCNLFSEMIFPYLDNNLTDEATACFLEHARNCPKCQAALEEARSFEFGMIGSFLNMDPPKDFVEKVMSDLHKAPVVEFIPEQKPKAKNISKKRVFGAIGTVAAAAVLVFAVNFASGTTDNTEPLKTADNGIGEGIVTAGENIIENDSSDINSLNENTSEKDKNLVDYFSITSGDNKANSSLKVFGVDRKPASSVGNNSSTVADNKKPNNNSNSSNNQNGNNSSNNSSSNNNNSNNNNSSNNNEGTGGSSSNNNSNNNGSNNDQNTSEVVLPTPSYGTETIGILDQRLIASYKSDNIYMPTISLDNETVSYYTKINDKIYLWKANLVEAEEPKCIGPVSDKNFELTKTTKVYDVNTSIFSPDMSILSMNARGEKSGIWISNLNNSGNLIQISEEGGGDILDWAPNSSKFVFTNEDGNLFVAYPIEKRIVSIFEGKVNDVAWGSDNKTLTLTSFDKNNKLSLYTVQVP